jgi:hypothetical protein
VSLSLISCSNCLSRYICVWGCGCGCVAVWLCGCVAVCVCGCVVSASQRVALDQSHVLIQVLSNANKARNSSSCSETRSDASTTLHGRSQHTSPTRKRKHPIASSTSPIRGRAQVSAAGPSRLSYVTPRSKLKQRRLQSASDSVASTATTDHDNDNDTDTAARPSAPHALETLQTHVSFAQQVLEQQRTSRFRSLSSSSSSKSRKLKRELAIEISPRRAAQDTNTNAATASMSHSASSTSTPTTTALRMRIASAIQNRAVTHRQRRQSVQRIAEQRRQHNRESDTASSSRASNRNSRHSGT